MISNSHLAVYLITLNDQKEQNYSILAWQIENIQSPCTVLGLVMEGKQCGIDSRVNCYVMLSTGLSLITRPEKELKQTVS